MKCKIVHIMIMNFTKKKFLWISIILFAFIAFPLLFYFYSQYQKLYADYEKTKLQLSKSAQTSGTDNSQLIIDKVGKLIELPEEIPTVASVSDKTKLKDQLFFANAENGDKVLVYKIAKKAILYRESINRIIEVSPINVSEPLPTKTLPISISQ